MVRLLEKIVLKALGPSLGVNQMWTKKNDHAPKSEGVDLLNTCPKRAVLKKKKSLTILLSSLGLYLLSLLVKCVTKMRLANLLPTIFTKSERFDLYTFNIIYM
jgi:hypothetical protein